MGRVGPPGPQGPAGPQGPPGPAGGISSFAFLCNTNQVTVAAAPTPGGQGGAVPFTNSVIVGTAVSFTSPTTININETGFYLISWEVFPQAGASAFGLFFDPDGTGPAPASLVLCSNYGSTAGAQPYQGQVIAQLTAGGVLTLNNINNNNQTLQNTDAGPNSAPVVSASIVIEKLA